MRSRISFALEVSIIYKQKCMQNRIGDAVPEVGTIIEGRGREVNAPSRFWLLLCVITLVLSVSGCTREGRASRLHEKAKEHVREGELVEAVELYDRLLEEFADTEAAGLAQREAVLYRGLADAVRSYPVREAREQVVRTARAIQKYRRSRRAWPRSLDQLVPDFLPEIPVDSWGRPLAYRAKERGRGYLLACYGADGEPGGKLENADWLVEDGSFVLRLSRAIR
jgi:hypothetical protein